MSLIDTAGVQYDSQQQTLEPGVFAGGAAVGIVGTTKMEMAWAAGARVGFAELFQNLHVVRQVDLGAADSTRNQQLEKAGGRQRLKKQPRQLAILLDLIGAGSDGRGHLLRGVKRRLSLSRAHGSVSRQRREV